MTFEEIKKLDKHTRGLPDEFTNSEWQIYFNDMKTKIKQCSQKKMKYSCPTTINGRNGDSYFNNDGDTQWKRYCEFINSILYAIRHGECDYCYHIYQIADLLAYEHDRLVVEYMEDEKCFKVYLIT